MMRKLMIKRIMMISLMGIALLALAGYSTLQITRSRTFQFFGGIVSRVETDQKAVALTFDDGPTQKTDGILDILDKGNVKATFYLIGSDIEKYPDEAKKLVMAGHEIGNHTYSHKRMAFKSLSYISTEIEDTDNLIREIGYKGNIQFRPPFGKKLVMLPYYLKKNSRKTILWDIEPNTYPEIDSSSENIVKYVIDNVKPGSIILLHPMYDTKGTTIGALEGIIEGLKSKEYTFRTVNELLEIGGY